MLLTVLALVLCLALCAWGPGTHLDLGSIVFRERHQRLPRSIAQLLGREQAAFLYGNLAPDFINFKAVGKKAVDCHRWDVVERLTCSRSEARRAFALGYLAHLAADTVAHNHFVPYHLARFPQKSGRGHYYWEQSADRFVPEERWELASRLKRDRTLAPLDGVVGAAFPDKPAPMRGHKLVFNQFVLISRRPMWRRGLDILHPVEHLELDVQLLEHLRREALGRIALALSEGSAGPLADLDPNGADAERKAGRIRRELLATHPNAESRTRAASAQAAPFLDALDFARPALEQRPLEYGHFAG